MTSRLFHEILIFCSIKVQIRLDLNTYIRTVFMKSLSGITILRDENGEPKKSFGPGPNSSTWVFVVFWSRFLRMFMS